MTLPNDTDKYNQMTGANLRIREDPGVPIDELIELITKKIQENGTRAKDIDIEVWSADDEVKPLEHGFTSQRRR